MVYAGQEFGEDTARIVGPNPLNWKKTQGWFGARARTLQAATRTLGALRAAHPAFGSDAVQMQAEDLPDGVAVYTRGAGRDAIVVAGNFGRRKRAVTVHLPAADAWQNVLEHKAVQPGPRGDVALTLEPGAVAVFASASVPEALR